MVLSEGIQDIQDQTDMTKYLQFIVKNSVQSNEKEKNMTIEEKILLNLSKAKKFGWGLGGIISLVIVYNASTLNVDSGETVRVQNNVSGEREWIQQEGIHFKLPFFSKVDIYNSVSTISITDDEKLIETSSAVRNPLDVTFADNYGGKIEVSFRAKLPTSDLLLEQMHQDVKSQENLEGNTLMTFAKDMVNLSTDQFLAQDFMQGGKGAFKQRLQEQSDSGMRVTKREKVVVNGEIADQSRKGPRDQAVTAQQFSYKVISQTNKDGSFKRRPHSLTKYGITITQVDLGEFTPAKDLKSYIDTIKRRAKEEADTIADQKIERAKATTEQLRGDRKRITAKNLMLMEKDAALVTGDKKIELGKQQATMEVIQKNKEADLAKIEKSTQLKMSQDNKGIQKANYEAAVYEAKATKEMGFAKAAVTKANYAAINPAILAKEVERDLGMAKWRALPNVKVKLPTTIMSGGGAAGNLDAYTNLHIMDKIK